ncbi:MAG: kynureninase [Steroidobacteraceae bacterium]
MNASSLLAEAAALDATDALAPLRARFALPAANDGKPLTYLCGHSLGLMPLAARTLVEEELDDWARLGVNGHHSARRPWIEYAELLQQGLARLTGAGTQEVVAMNALSVNLHLLLASFYRPQGRRRCIVIEAGAFSSDRHAVASVLAWHGLDPAAALIEIAPAAGSDLIGEEALEALLAARGAEMALVLWPGVQYRTGEAFDLARVAAAAHRAGAVCGFDLAHAIGNLPLALHEDDADFAVWCSYKYLNAGPGAIGGAFMHSRHSRAALPGFAGWWGHDPQTRFRMEPGFMPAAGAAAWQVSNPPVLSAAPLLASLQIFDEAGIPALRAKSLSLDAFLRRHLAARFGALLQAVTPAAAARHGCQLSLRVRAGRDAGRALFEGLAARGVVADWREPDILRIAPAPLYNTHADVARLLIQLDELLPES